MNCSFCATAGAASAALDNMAAASISLLRTILVSSSFSPVLAVPGLVFAGFLAPSASDRRSALRSPASFAPTAPSVGKRPKSELLLANRYEPGKPMWLFDEKIADQRSKDDEFQVSNRFRRQRHTELGWNQVQDNRQNEDKGCTDERTHDRSQPADDHHKQKLQRTVDRERQRLPRAQIDERPECARHADDKRGDRESRELCVERPDADQLGGDVHIADCHPLSAEIAANEVLRQNREHRYEGQAQQIALDRRVQDQTEEIQCRC